LIMRFLLLLLLYFCICICYCFLAFTHLHRINSLKYRKALWKPLGRFWWTLQWTPSLRVRVWFSNLSKIRSSRAIKISFASPVWRRKIGRTGPRMWSMGLKRPVNLYVVCLLVFGFFFFSFWASLSAVFIC
jgi:hypothetical protein